MRLSADFWVHAYLARLSQAHIPAYVTRHGDDTAGAIIVKLSTLDGQAKAFQRRYDFEADAQVWSEISAGPEGDVDAELSRQTGYDPDLWVIEVEDRQGRTLLDQDGLT